MSDSIRSSNKGAAQEPAQDSAGTARSAGAEDAGTAAAEVRWVGAQHLFEGYCGRAAAAVGQGQWAEGIARPAPLTPPAPVFRRSRQAVVRIGPRSRLATDAGESAAGGDETPRGEARPRAA